jgi:hypothetical protein
MIPVRRKTKPCSVRWYNYIKYLRKDFLPAGLGFLSTGGFEKLPSA